MTISTIAIDGPAASGKSTVGGLLAERLSYLYFDTGVMYRAVTWVALKKDIPISDERAITQLAERIEIRVTQPTVEDGRQYTVYTDGEDATWDIRLPEVDANVSPVSAYPGVRQALLEQQRRIAESGDVVMLGRDIGTVILPDADLKIYLDASVETRAKRRYDEIVARGDPSDHDEVLRYMRRRDKIDSEREVAPLRPAIDAVIIDTTEMSVQDVVRRIEDVMKERANTQRLLARSRWSWDDALPSSFGFHHFVDAVLRVLARRLVRLELRGLDNVPGKGPLVVVINHINFLDPALAAIFVPRDLLIMTKAENLRKPIFGTLIKWYGVFPVRRGEVDRSALRNALNILKRNHALLIAPEGTRSHHGRIGEARNGIAYIALKSGAPILPVAIWGGERFWQGFWRLRRARVEMEIGEPFTLQANGQRIRRVELTRMTQEIMWRLAILMPAGYRGMYGELSEGTAHYTRPYRAQEEREGHSDAQGSDRFPRGAGQPG